MFRVRANGPSEPANAASRAAAGPGCHAAASESAHAGGLAAGADRPQQAGGRWAAPIRRENAEEEEPKDPSQKAVKAAPPWLVSMVIHMVALILAAMIYFAAPAKKIVELEVVYAEELGEQVLDDQLQSPESLNMEIETPVLSFDVKPSDDPLAAPPILDVFNTDATSAVDQHPGPQHRHGPDRPRSGRQKGAARRRMAATPRPKRR